MGLLKKLSIKMQLALFLFAFLILTAFEDQGAAMIVTAAAAVAASALAQAVFNFPKERKFRFSESALITGLLIGFVLMAQGDWWIYAAAAILAIASKQLIRIKGKHIFNPAGFGALAAVIIFGSGTQWHGAYVWYAVIPFGIYFVYRIERLPIVIAYYLAACVLYGAQAVIQKTSFIDGMLYLNHFFVFIMLIEPKTSPFDQRQMILFGAIASALCFGLSFVNLSPSAELPVLLLMNALYAGYQIKRKQ